MMFEETVEKMKGMLFHIVYPETTNTLEKQTTDEINILA